MERRYTIGRLAGAAGVPTTTVRYYERRGLLRPVLRMGSGEYRSYGEAELERLRFIRSAQASGFSLDDIAALLSLRDSESAPSAEVQDLIRARLREVAARLADLQRVESVLKASLRSCQRHAAQEVGAPSSGASRAAAAGRDRNDQTRAARPPC